MKHIIVLSVFALSACGAPEGKTDQTHQNVDMNSNSDGANVGENSADASSVAYYDELTFEKLDTYVAGAAAFPEQSNGDNAFLATVFLQKAGTFILFYSEGNGEVTGTGHSLNLRTDSQRKVTGQWKVDGATLAIGDYLRCNAMTVNSKNGLRCTLNKAIGQQAAVGKSATLKAGFAGKSPDDSEWADYD